MKYANLVIKSNAVFTGLTESPFKGGVAIQGNYICAVGKEEEIDQYIGPHTEVYQYGDQMIMAGFIDAHVHYYMGALAASEHMTTEIAFSTSEEECLQMVASYAKEHPEEPRICGMGWFPANWKDAPLPTKESLDRIIPDKPVYLMCADAHTAWLNSKALEECGITRDTVIECGEVCKDKQGEPNGILKEFGIFVAFAKMLSLPIETLKEMQKGFLAEIVKNGVTFVSDMSAYDLTEETINLYLSAKELEKEGNLYARLNLYPNLVAPNGYEKLKSLKKRLDTDKLKIAGVKQFVDGVTSTYTGYLLEPYSDRQDQRGSTDYPFEVYKKYVTEANKEGLGVRLHCIADGSVRLALDVFEISNRENNNIGNHKQIRNTIEHCENIHPNDIARFSELGVVASMQPLHLTLDSNEKIGRMGLERCRYEWPHRSLLDAGTKLAFGTDYPVVGFNPFPSIYAAISRCDEKGNPTGVNPEEKITLAEALTAYTREGAYAYGREEELGTLEVGKLADIVVVDKNLFEIPEREIQDCTVMLTIMDGNIVYEE